MNRKEALACLRSLVVHISFTMTNSLDAAITVVSGDSHKW